MLSGEATNTNSIVLGLTLTWLKPTIYCTRGEHANHYTTDVVFIFENQGKFRCKKMNVYEDKIKHISNIIYGRDRLVVGFTTTWAISAYHH